MNGVVLVLNQNYEPLNVCNLPRAFRLLFGEKAEVIELDHYTCQYCGRQSHDLTLDHVTPRHRGGGHTWDNLVAACKPCNHRKGGKLLGEVRLRLIRNPFEPRSDVYSLFTPYLSDDRNEAWRTYLFLGRN